MDGTQATLGTVKPTRRTIWFWRQMPPRNAAEPQRN